MHNIGYRPNRGKDFLSLVLGFTLFVSLPRGATVQAERKIPVDEFEIAEVAQKVISSAKVMRHSHSEQELSFEFTDGTSFSFSCRSSATSETCIYRGGVGEPEVIRELKISGDEA